MDLIKEVTYLKTEVCKLKKEETAEDALELVTAVAVDVTGSVTAAELLGKLITSTSAAAVAVTLPTATLLGQALAAKLGIETTALQGHSMEFVVDNSAGANTVTVTVNTGITVNTPAITGGATLTVSTANAVGIFRIVFTSATTAKILG